MNLPLVLSIVVGLACGILVRKTTSLKEISDEKSLNKSQPSFRFLKKHPFVPLLLLLLRKKSLTL